MSKYQFYIIFCLKVLNVQVSAAWNAYYQMLKITENDKYRYCLILTQVLYQLSSFLCIKVWQTLP